jgi:tetratricopeptide (TPR) repeat protein
MALLIALLLFQAAGEDLEALLQEGLRRYSKGELREAIVPWEKGLSAARAQEDKLFAGTFLGNLGLAFAGLKEYDQAEARLEEAIRLGEAADDRPGLKMRLNSLGSVYLLRERPERALPVLRRALELALDLQDQAAEADVLGNLSLAYHAMGNYGQAITHSRLAIDKSPESRKSSNVVRLAALLQDCGDVEGSLAVAQAAKANVEPDSRDAATIEKLIAANSAVVANGEGAVRQARVEGLERMLARLRKFKLDALALEVERQILSLRSR